MHGSAYLILIALTVSGAVRAGVDGRVDSLRVRLARVSGEEKLRTLLSLGNALKSNHPDSAIHYGRVLLAMSAEQGNREFKAYSLNLCGDGHNGKGNYDSSIYYYLETLTLIEPEGNKAKVSHVINSLGNAYLGTNDFERAIEHYRKSYHLACTIPLDSHMRGISAFGIANCSQELGMRDSAIHYFDIAANTFRNEGNHTAYVMTMIGIAELYESGGDLVRAESLYKDAVRRAGEMNNNYVMGMAVGRLGIFLVQQRKYPEGISFLKKALEIHSARKAWSNLSEMSFELSKAFEATGDYRQAFQYFRDHKSFSDSVLNEKSRMQLLELEAKYETEKQREELARKGQEVEEAKAGEARKGKLLVAGLALAFVFLVLAYFSFRQYRMKKAANILLEQQASEIGRQKNIIEQKNKDITDSIQYAKHIQEAILPPQDLLYEWLGECFVVYIPRDIVSGDFYWVRKPEGSKVLFSAIDCTGHGVPGALMSVLSHAAISGVTQQYDLTRPALILNYLSDALKETFRHHHYEGNVSDGMDLAICMLDRQTMKLHFAGARNPVVIVSGGTIAEIRGDKQYISGTREQTCAPFTHHERDVKKGDMVYVFTDGYADQFGGASGKKFKQSRLKELLLEISGHNIHRQKQMLEKTIREWKGDLEQVDDILVIGVRV